MFQIFILDSLISEGFCPKVIRQGRRFKLLSIEELNIKIVPSYNYFPGDEFAMAEMFGIQFERRYFPFSMFKSTNLKFVGKIPNLHQFFCKFDSLGRRGWWSWT